MKRFKVCKFGGTSVANADCIRRAAATIRSYEGVCVVVVSAMGGMTNRLIEAAEFAAQGNLDPARATAGDLRRRHEELIEELFSTSSLSSSQSQAEGLKHVLKQKVGQSVAEFESICESLAVLREKTPRILDVVVARGERLLAQIFAKALDYSGCQAIYVDATEVLFVENDGVYLSPNVTHSSEAISVKVMPHLQAGRCVVIPGFIAQGPGGEIVTLGRGGTDYSASIFGGLIGASQVTLYKEVDGLLTADPRFVPDARVIPELHYREATELAFYGAKVLHPRTIIPLMKDKIPLVIKSSFRPEFSGTKISSESSTTEYPVKALTAITAQALMTVQGNGMMGVPGIAGRTFLTLAQAGLSTSFISQASSESSICFVVPEIEVERALVVLRGCFKLELEHGLIESISYLPQLAVAAVVGQGMRGHTGVAARTMLAIAQTGANIIAIAQGSSELNISVVINEADREPVLRALHREYRLHELTRRPERREHQSNLVVFGLGQIGRTLMRQLERQHEYFHETLQIDMRIIAVSDSKGSYRNACGLSSKELNVLSDVKTGRGVFNESGQSSETNQTKHEAISSVLTAGTLRGNPEDCYGVSLAEGRFSGNKIFIDCTAGETYDAVKSALEAGSHIVLANKKPLAVSQGAYDALFALARERGLSIRFEATVGAGLPVLDTLAKLQSAGDEIISIEGCLSGTLGYLMTRICEGIAFSDAVKEAFEKGFTEPDPREDLSGQDVARKALILARTLGYRLELADIEVEALFSQDASHDDPQQFIKNLKQYDSEFEARLGEAIEQGSVLRYVASIHPDVASIHQTKSGQSSRCIVRVGLQAVPAGGPMGMLRGTDNQVNIRSRRYDKNLLVVTGPGAGAEVTAAGVLNDVMVIAQTENMSSSLSSRGAQNIPRKMG